ncbi:MAG: DUF2608 domain-containing protein [Holosporaceae bacterium]|jgi:hypothetical protein|nr:DUF2608 domain-containing protein [Holosporaceae bacterium]
MKNIFCQLFMIIALLQWSVMGSNPANSSSSGNSNFSQGNNIIHCNGWKEITAKLRQLQAKHEPFGDFPLLLVDYNDTLVSLPYNTVIREFIRTNGHTIRENVIVSILKACHSKYTSSEQYYEGEVAEGALDSIRSYNMAGFHTLVLTLGNSSLHKSRCLTMDQAGISPYIKFPRDFFKTDPNEDILSFSAFPLCPPEYLMKYINGHIYCPSLQGSLLDKSKGNTLWAFTHLLKRKPSYIVVVDDRISNILTINEACEKLKIPFLGFVIDLETENVKRIQKLAQAHDKKTWFKSRLD